MARLLYGNTPADFTLSPSGKILPNVPLTVWTAREGGTQVTDLLNYNSAATAIITSDAAGLVRFYAPDGTKSTLWIDSGQGSRLAVRPVNLPTAGLSVGTVGTGSAAVQVQPDGDDAWTLNFTLPTAGANGVNTAAIQDSAVTSDKIADGSIMGTDINSAANIATTQIAGNPIPRTLIDAKGDLLVGTGNDAVGRLAAGADGTLLVADAAQPSGVKWSSTKRLEGTVAPEGVITAPPLSRYLQTSGAMTATGAMEWVKATGTGNTGWVAGAESDTGWRNIPYTDGDANWTTGTLRVRRRGALVEVVMGGVGMSALGGANFIYTLPTGFKNGTPGIENVGGVIRESAVAGYPVWFNIWGADKVGGQAQALSGTFNAGTWRFSGAFPTFMTNDAWPTSLPGTAA